MKPHLGAAILAVVTQACASTPTYHAMLEDLRHAEPSSEARADDEHAVATGTLDRDAYVRAVLDENPSIASARAAWRGALAHVRGAGVLDDPMVSLSIAPLSIGAPTARFGFEAMISQRFPWPEKLTLDVAVAKAEAQAARGDFDAVRLELALSAALLYDAYFVAVRALGINDKYIALVRELKAAALAQLEAGRAAAQDPLEADMELAHIEHDAISLEATRDVTIAQMNELLHRDPSAPLAPPADLVLRSSAQSSASANANTSDASHRPEIEATKLHARAQAERARRARRDWFPDLTVSTSYNSMWDAPEHRWMVGVGLELPLQPGRRAGAIDVAEAEQARFESEARRMTDKARTEIAVAEKRFDEAEHVLRLHETRLLPIARDQLDAARAGFIASRNDFAVLIHAAKNLRSLELGREMARAEVDRRGAELDRARGHVPGLGAGGSP